MLSIGQKKICLQSVEITTEEINSFIGLLVLLGITKKSDISIEALWNCSCLHYAPFASAAMSRERFQLIIKNITFDDLDTRKERQSHKFYKMSDIFNDFKDNLPLVIPSFLLCVNLNTSQMELVTDNQRLKTYAHIDV
jgi:hypothetical protein